MKCCKLSLLIVLCFCSSLYSMKEEEGSQREEARREKEIRREIEAQQAEYGGVQREGKREKQRQLEEKRREQRIQEEATIKRQRSEGTLEPDYKAGLQKSRQASSKARDIKRRSARDKKEQARSPLTEYDPEQVRRDEEHWDELARERFEITKSQLPMDALRKENFYDNLLKKQTEEQILFKAALDWLKAEILLYEFGQKWKLEDLLGYDGKRLQEARQHISDNFKESAQINAVKDLEFRLSTRKPSPQPQIPPKPKKVKTSQTPPAQELRGYEALPLDVEGPKSPRIKKQKRATQTELSINERIDKELEKTWNIFTKGELGMDKEKAEAKAVFYYFINIESITAKEDILGLIKQIQNSANFFYNTDKLKGSNPLNLPLKKIALFCALAVRLSKLETINQFLNILITEPNFKGLQELNDSLLKKDVTVSFNNKIYPIKFLPKEMLRLLYREFYIKNGQKIDSEYKPDIKAVKLVLKNKILSQVQLSEAESAEFQSITKGDDLKKFTIQILEKNKPDFWQRLWYRISFRRSEIDKKQKEIFAQQTEVDKALQGVE